MTPQRTNAKAVIGGIAIAAVGIVALGATINAKTPTASTTTPAVASTPAVTAQPPKPAGPTGEQVTTHVTRGTGHATLDDACAAGIRWTCNVETVTPRGSTLEVRVRTLENPDGDSVARGWFNFVTAGNDSPMPDLSYVQITTAQGGAVGSYRKPL